MLLVYKILRSHSFKGSWYFNRKFLNDKIFSKHIGIISKSDASFQTNGDGIFQLGPLSEALKAHCGMVVVTFLSLGKSCFITEMEIWKKEETFWGWEGMPKGGIKARNLIMGWWVPTPPLLVSSQVTRMHVGSQDLLSVAALPLYPCFTVWELRGGARSGREMLETDRGELEKKMLSYEAKVNQWHCIHSFICLMDIYWLLLQFSWVWD